MLARSEDAWLELRNALTSFFPLPSHGVSMIVHKTDQASGLREQAHRAAREHGGIDVLIRLSLLSEVVPSTMIFDCIRLLDSGEVKDQMWGQVAVQWCHSCIH